VPSTVVTDVAPGVWDQFVESHPAAHFLQTSPWGSLKVQFGWDVQRVALADGDHLIAGAQILYRHLPAGIGKIAYIPRGPLANWSDETEMRPLLSTIKDTAQAHGAVAVTVEPDLTDDPQLREIISALGFRPAPITIQPPRTIIVDISYNEDTILGAMKSKTRYNVRLAGRKGVSVHAGSRDDLAAFNGLMAITGTRDGFDVHSPAYYEAAYDHFVPRGWASLILAEVEEEPVAGVMVFALGRQAWYVYGASSDTHRNKMPTYLVQWEAIRWARAQGCTTYDLWGVPDADEETLESDFTTRSDGLWGVYRFKRGFGGKLVRTVGTWDLVCAPARYAIYRSLSNLRQRMSR